MVARPITSITSSMARSPFSSSSTSGISSCPSFASQSASSRLLGADVDAPDTILYGIFFIGGFSLLLLITRLHTTAGRESPPTFHYAWGTLLFTRPVPRLNGVSTHAPARGGDWFQRRRR